MRHGKSSWATPTQADFDRPLKTRGERAAEQMGRWLDQTGHVPDLVLTSTAVRARSTTDIVASVLGLPSAVIVEEPRIYDASTNQLLYCIAEHGGDTNTLMVVGHNPGLESLTWLLARQTPPPSPRTFSTPTPCSRPSATQRPSATTTPPAPQPAQKSTRPVGERPVRPRGSPGCLSRSVSQDRAA